MKITRRQLRKIIQEELRHATESSISESAAGAAAAGVAGAGVVGATGAGAAGSAATAGAAVAATPVVAVAALAALVGYGAYKWVDKSQQKEFVSAVEKFRKMGPALIGPALWDTVDGLGTNEALLFAALERIEELRVDKGCAAVKRSASFGAKHADLPGADEFWKGIASDLSGTDKARYKQVINAWADKGCLKWRYK